MVTTKANLESNTDRLKSKRVIVYERNKTKTIRYEELTQQIDNQFYAKKKEIEEELKKIHDDYLVTMKKVGANREYCEWKEYI